MSENCKIQNQRVVRGIGFIKVDITDLFDVDLSIVHLDIFAKKIYRGLMYC